MEENRVQRVRFAEKIIQFQTVTNDEIEYLYLADVQRRFSTVTAFSLNGIHLSSMTHGELGIKAYPNEIIDAIAPETSTDSAVAFQQSIFAEENQINS